MCRGCLYTLILRTSWAETTPSSGMMWNSRGFDGKLYFVGALVNSSWVNGGWSPSSSTVMVNATGIRDKLFRYTSCRALNPEQEIQIEKPSGRLKNCDLPRAIVANSRLSLSKCKVGHTMQPLMCKLSTSRLSFTTKSTLSTKSPLRFEENDKLKDLCWFGSSVRQTGVISIVPPKSLGFGLWTNVPGM